MTPHASPRLSYYTASRRKLDLAAPLARGGEATVYPVHGEAATVAKIYAQLREGIQDKLRYMQASPPADPTRGLGHASIAWPRELLFDGQGRLAGYSMPYIPGTVTLLEVFNPRRRAQVLPGFDRRYLHRTARNLASALAALHAAGYVVGDLNEGNILVTPRTLVTLIDTDSFQVEERRDGKIVIHPCPVGRAEYTPPELQGQAFASTWRRAEHDGFGLAVLLFQLLMGGSHPFRSRWLGQGEPPALEDKIAKGLFPWAQGADRVAPPAGAGELAHLHPELAELFLRCFVDGHARPALRPSAEAWSEALEVAEGHLVACPQGHFFDDAQRRCPECGARGKTRLPASPRRHKAPKAGAASVTVPPAAVGAGVGLLRGLAAIGSWPVRLVANTLAGLMGLRRSGAGPTLGAWLGSLRWTAGMALLAALAGGLAAGGLALAQVWLGLAEGGERLAALPGAPAGLWALGAGGLTLALGVLMRRLGQDPGLALRAEHLSAAAGDAAWAAWGWLWGWSAMALLAAVATDAGLGASFLALPPAGLAGPPAGQAWTLAWAAYGGTVAFLGPGRDAPRPPAAPLGWGALASVFGAVGWVLARLGGVLVG